MKPVIAIAMSMALLPPPVAWPVASPSRSRTSTTTCLEDLESPVPPTCKKCAAELTRRVSEEAQSNYPESPTYPGNDE